jgi:hypothetical protein
MAKPVQHSERITKKRWLRALQLAKLLFDDQAYSADYLMEIEDLIKEIYLGPNDLAIQLPFQWNFTTSKAKARKILYS